MSWACPRVHDQHTFMSSTGSARWSNREISTSHAQCFKWVALLLKLDAVVEGIELSGASTAAGSVSAGAVTGAGGALIDADADAGAGADASGVDRKARSTIPDDAGLNAEGICG